MMKVLLVLTVVHLKLQFCQAALASNIRLVDGVSKSEGRIEVFYNGSWGTVCDNHWDLKDANVACHSLGLPNATSAPYRAPFGQGSGPIWMDDVKCSGSEISLLECPHRGFGSHDCEHSEDAGVACGYPPLKKFTITNLTGEIISPGYPNATERANYEWIFKTSVPRPVAALYFEEIDLKRRNRGASELSVKNSKNVTVIHIRNEERKPWSGWLLKDPWMVRFHSIFTLRQRDGFDGSGFRLRYFIFSDLDDKGSCASHWHVQVLVGVGALNISWNPLTNIPNVNYLVTYNATGKDVQNFTMVTNGTSVRITHLRTETFYSIQLVGFNPISVSPVMYSCAKLVQTKAVSWLLVGGKQPNEGLIQMDYNDIWGRVCALNWDIKDAKVACRTLKLPPATYPITQSKQFSVSKLKPWVANLRCLGNETSLIDCPHGGWGNLPPWCRSDYVAGVVCGYPNVTKIDITSVFGVITSLGYPRYMEQAHYVWTIRPSVPRAHVVVYFEDIDLGRHDKGVSNLTLIDPVGTQLLLVQNRNKPKFSYRFNKTPPAIVFYSSFTSALNTRGFRMFYLVMDDAQPSLRENWNISARSTSPRYLRVHWSQFNSTNMNLVAYLITHAAKSQPSAVFYSIADENSTSIVINNLVGYTHYNVHVFAYLREINTGTYRMYTGKLIDVQTLEGVPDRAPPDIEITFINFRYVHVKWKPIPRENAHGNLLGYNVYYQDARTTKKTMIITASNHHYTVLTNLIPAMMYHLQIAGFTAKGQGQIKILSFLTKCGDVIESRLAGSISIPSISPRNWDVDCEWTLKPGLRGALIVVMIDVSIPLPSFYPCSQLHFNLISGRNRTMDTFCGKRQLVSLVSYSSAKVRFHLSHSWQFRLKAAIILNTSYLVLKNGFDSVQLYQEWKITVTHHNYTTITVKWNQLPKIGLESAKFVAVCVSDTDEIYAGSANSSATNIQVGNLIADSEYKVRVLAFLDKLNNIDRKRDILKTPTITIRTLKKDYNPRFPLLHDIESAVRMRVKGRDVLQWNQIYDHTFKKALAHEVTGYCSRDKRCPRPIRRSKRSVMDHIIIFTSVEVHFLPGYPMQTAYAHNPENWIAALAFYLKFPPESGIDSTSVLPQAILLDAVKASVGPIGKAINKTILSVFAHRRAITEPPPKTKKPGSNKAAVIGGSVTAVVIVIVIIASVFIIARGHCVMKREDEVPVIELQHSEAKHEEQNKPEDDSPSKGHENLQEEIQQEEQQERPTETQGQPGEQEGVDVESRGVRVMELNI